MLIRQSSLQINDKRGIRLRRFVAVMMVFFLMGCASNNSINERDNDANELTQYHEDKYFDAYVLSKKINTFSVSDEPGDKGSEIIVTMANKQDRSLINTIKKKQKVRIWHDNIRESFPGQTTAYRVEVLE